MGKQPKLNNERFLPAISRRRLLKGALGVGALASVEALMPPNVRRALAETAPNLGSLDEIKHVVFLMQENRSFDHYFGTLAGVRGFDDEDILTLSSGRSVFYQPDPENPEGYLLPFHLDTRSTSGQRIPSTNHSWGVQHAAWNGGKMDNWVRAHRKAEGANGPYCMTYYKREDIPFQFALAEAFTLCDNYHCSMMGPTWPNRTYWMTGMIDPEGHGGGPMISNETPPAGFTWTTYAERLEKAGVSWKVYQEEDNYDCNALEFFKNFRQASKGSPLYEKAMYRGPAGRFEYDAIHDKLPTVSWIITTSWQSEHPDYMPADGAAFVASKLDAIAANPEVWAKTLFVLNYDENDGIFDHVPPPVPPPDTPVEFVDGVPIGAGFRVPCILISPWTAGGRVCSDLFDHTSCLRFLEVFTGIKEPNICDWRRRTFGDFTSALRFKHKQELPPIYPDTSGPLVRAKYEVSNLPKPVIPGADQQPPKQQKSRR